MHKSNGKTILALNLILTLFFSAYKSFENMISEILAQRKQPSLGSISLFLAYSFFALFSLIQSQFINRFRFKQLLIYGGFLYCSYVISSVLLTLTDQLQSWQVFVFLLSASLKGIGAACLWCGLAGYKKILILDNNQGAANSRFWGILQSSFFWGNLLGASLLNYFNHQIYLISMSSLMLLSVLLICLIGDPQLCPQPYIISQHSKLQQLNLSQSLAKMRKVLGRKQTQCLLPFFYSTGTVIGMTGGYLFLVASNASLIDFTDQQRISQLNLFTQKLLMSFGLASIVTGFLLSTFLNNRNVYLIVYLVQVFMLVQICVSLLSSIYPGVGVVGFIAGAMLGMIDTTNNSIASLISQVDYPNQLQAYMIFRIVSPIGIASFYAFSLILNKNLVLLTYVAAFIALLSCAGLLSQLGLKSIKN